MPRPSTGLNTASRKLPDGTTEFRWYHRRTGRLIGCSREGWTKDAAAARARELDEEPTSGPPAGSFGQLCSLYLASPRYKRLAPKTQKGYRDHIDTMRGMWETVPIGGITRSAVVALHQRYEDRPWQGNAIIRTLRLVLNHGLHKVEMPGLLRNAAERTELYATRARTRIWDQRCIDLFLAAARPRLRLAFALLLYTVQRPGDMLELGKPQTFKRDGRTWIRLRQSKTGEALDVPCHERLVAEIAVAERSSTDSGVTSTLFVSSPTGKAWSYRNFARSWDLTLRRANWALAKAAIRKRGGLPPRADAKNRDAAKAAVRASMLHDLQRRDLRRTGVVQLALAGATVPQIAALTGWRIETTQKIVDTYLPRRGEVALGGVRLWESAEPKVVPLAPRRRTRGS